VPNICFFLPLLHRFYHFFGAFVDLNSAGNVCGTDFDLEGVEILAKNDSKRQKETNIWHWAKFILVLHLTPCLLNFMNVLHRRFLRRDRKMQNRGKKGKL